MLLLLLELDGQRVAFCKLHMLDKLKEKLKQVKQSIPPVLLHSMFDGTTAGLQRVTGLNGSYIAK